MLISPPSLVVLSQRLSSADTIKAIGMKTVIIRNKVYKLRYKIHVKIQLNARDWGREVHRSSQAVRHYLSETSIFIRAL